MTDIGPLCSLLIVVGAVCLIAGARKPAVWLIAGGIVLAVGLPLVSCLLGQARVSFAPLLGALGWLLIGILVAAVIAAWIAFTRQRRALAKWREPDDPKLGQKRRLDPE